MRGVSRFVSVGHPFMRGWQFLIDGRFIKFHMSIAFRAKKVCSSCKQRSDQYRVDGLKLKCRSCQEKERRALA